MGYVRGRMAMSILLSNTVCLRGTRVRRRMVPWVVDDAAYEATRGGAERKGKGRAAGDVAT